MKRLRDKDELLKEENTLTQTKTGLEGYLKDTWDELEWFKWTMWRGLQE